MLFLNPWLLAGLAGVAIPVIIHLVRQQAAKPVDWGAMRFLFDTISVRRRRMEWEDLLLMAARCLLLGLAALALARPFVPPDSTVPWLFVLPAVLLGIAFFGASFVLSSGKARWIVRGIALFLLVGAAALVFLEKVLNLKRFEASGRRDVALVIDGSASMECQRDGVTVFSKALEEAKQLVKEAPRGTAFTVILGGPAPEVKTAAPLTHRADVLGVLDSLQPIGGSFRAHEALGVATLGLAEGTNASKEIVVFTDTQRGGWRFDNPGAWDGLERAWEAMPSRPKLILRDFGTPVDFRNIAVTGVELSRSVVGTDREVVFQVTVENTGTDAVTPGPVTLEIGGQRIGESPVGLLVPGQKETVDFKHRFTRAGPAVIEARIEAKDDLLADNRSEKVVMVRERLKVLLVDGNPSGSFFERAAGYAALALAPTTSLIGGKPAGETFLMDPRVVSITALKEEDLDDAAVVVLADVSRLPARLADRLASKVAEGAGLLVLAGPRAEVAFYNGWQGIDGPLLPIELGQEGADEDGISPADSTFVHESLARFTKAGDLTEAKVTRWRKSGKAREGGVQGAAFSNGDAFLASRIYGNGRCLMTLCALDSRAGNFPARRAFVPLVHELVTWAAGGGIDLNVRSAWSPSVILSQSGGGLSGRYFRNHELRDKPLLERIDAAIDFDWEEGSPDRRLQQDGFSVQWRGSLVAPVTGEYQFSAEVDERVELRIGTLSPLKADRKNPRMGGAPLKAGEAVPIEVIYQEDGWLASVQLKWTPPGGVEQVIPSSAFLPFGMESAEPMKVLDPRGLPREARLKAGRRGQELAISGPAVPGIYQITAKGLPEGLFPGMEGTLPVAGGRDAGESRFEVRTADDLDLIRKHTDLLLPKSVADVLGVLQGKGFGREIWKWLAVAAFVFFLLESVLARWVSRSRRAAEDVRVDFGEDKIWRAGA
jgi:hypothetical protein